MSIRVSCKKNISQNPRAEHRSFQGPGVRSQEAELFLLFLQGHMIVIALSISICLPYLSPSCASPYEDGFILPIMVTLMAGIHRMPQHQFQRKIFLKTTSVLPVN
jgi:hypothetical protein